MKISIFGDSYGAQWIETGQTVDLDPTSYCQETKSKLLDMFDPV